MTANRVQLVGTKSVGRPIAVASKPLRNVGGFFAFSLDVVVTLFKPPFAWREFLEQTWFVARVSLIRGLRRVGRKLYRSYHRYPCRRGQASEDTGQVGLPDDRPGREIPGAAPGRGPPRW
jgi:hypothetical protein